MNKNVISLNYIEKYIRGSSLDLDGINTLGTLIEKYQPKNVLELGSGVSSLVFAQHSEELKHVFSVDDGAFYLNESASRIPDSIKNKFTFIHAPIQKFLFKGKSYSTYSPRTLEENITEKIEFLFIDGPYARLYGRISTLFLASQYLAPNAIIVLDDALRSYEKAAFHEWKQVWGNELNLLEEYPYRKGMRVFQLKNPNKMSLLPFGLKYKLKEWVGV